MKEVDSPPDEVRGKIVRKEPLSAEEFDQLNKWLTYWLSASKPIVVDPWQLQIRPFEYLACICESYQVFSPNGAAAAALLPKGLIVECGGDALFYVRVEVNGSPDSVVTSITGHRALWNFVASLWNQPTKHYGVAEVDALISKFFANPESPP